MSSSEDSGFELRPSDILNMIDHATSREDPDGLPKEMMPVFIWGPPGVGKTDLVRTLGKTRGCRIVAMHLPQYDPTDLKGIPVRMDDGEVRWVPTSYLPGCHRKEGVSPSEGYSAMVAFPYAREVACYLIDERGREVYRLNDPSLADYDGVDAQITVSKLGDGFWNIELTGTGSGIYTLEIVDKAIIFLDELSAADQSTQNAALQLVLDRRVGEYNVPRAVPVLAAGNRETDGAFAQPLSHPLCNRFQHLTIRPDPDDWIEWAMMNNIRPEVIGMIKWDGGALFDYDPDKLVNGNYGFATPRTWAFLSQQYASLAFFESFAGDDNRNRATRLRMAMFAGIVGRSAASKFVGYLSAMHDMPHPEEIASGEKTELGDVERSKSFGLLYALIYKIKELHDKFYDRTLSHTEQSDEWTVPRDHILNFVTNNFAGDAGGWMTAFLSQKAGIHLASLRGEAMMRYSEKFSRTFEMTGKK